MSPLEIQRASSGKEAFQIQANNFCIMLYLHVGTHKTGTSTIQQSLRDSRAALREEGIAYLEPSFQDIKAGDVMRAKNFDQNLVKKLSNEFKKAFPKSGDFSTYVLSNEAFSGMPYDGYLNSRIVAQTLRAALTYPRIKIIIYLRSQDQFLESLYTQSIHEGGTDSFSDFLKQFQNERSFDYQRIIEDFSDIFGAEQVCVRSYYRESRDGLLKGFSELIGSQKLMNWQGGDRNRGYSKKALEIARICNASLDRPNQAGLRRVLQSVMAKEKGEKYSFFNRESRQEFLERFSATNLTVTSRDREKDTSNFFPPLVNSPSVPEKGGEGINSDQVARLVIELTQAKCFRNQTIFRKIARKVVTKIPLLRMVVQRIRN